MDGLTGVFGGALRFGDHGAAADECAEQGIDAPDVVERHELERPPRARGRTEAAQQPREREQGRFALAGRARGEQQQSGLAAAGELGQQAWSGSVRWRGGPDSPLVGAAELDDTGRMRHGDPARPLILRRIGGGEGNHDSASDGERGEERDHVR